MRTPDGRDPTPEQHEAAVQRVIAAGKKVGCPTGIHAMDPQNALERAKQGMQFLAVGSDLRMMVQKAQETLKAVMPEKVGGELARY
jgi:4-hydroxy-2-oxoheptanedioate aldolase